MKGGKTTQIRVYREDKERINEIISHLQIEMKRKVTTAEFINMLINKFIKDVEYIERRLKKDVE